MSTAAVKQATAHINSLSSLLEVTITQPLRAQFNQHASPEAKAKFNRLSQGIESAIFDTVMADSDQDKIAKVTEMCNLMAQRAEKVAELFVTKNPKNAEVIEAKLSEFLQAPAVTAKLVAPEKYADTLQDIKAPTLAKIMRQAYMA